MRVAFADSLRTGWIIGTIIAALGFLCALAMKGLVLHEETDEDWGLQDQEDRGVEMLEA